MLKEKWKQKKKKKSVHRNHKNSFQRAWLKIYRREVCIAVFARAAVTHYISALMIKVLHKIVIVVVTVVFVDAHTHTHTRRHLHSHRNLYRLCGAYNSQLTHRMSIEGNAEIKTEDRTNDRRKENKCQSLRFDGISFYI